MNYIKELNGFREWLLSNDLPANAVSLWYTLMSINNAARWKKRFNAPNAIVRQLSGLSKQGLLDARAKLKEQNLITFEKGRRGKASVYEMISFCQLPDASLSTDESLHQSEAPSTVQSSSQSSSQSGATSSGESSDEFQPVLKQKEKQERSIEDAFAETLSLFEQNIGKAIPIVQEELNQWIRLVGAPMVMEAIHQTAKYGGQTFSYLEKILQEWQEVNLTTIDAVQAYTKQQNFSRKNNTIPFRKQDKNAKPCLFDALRGEV